MGPTTISASFLGTSITVIILLEIAAANLASRLGLPRLWTIGFVRIAQILVVVALATTQTHGLQTIGLDRSNLLSGIKKGLFWSAGFAIVALVLFLVLFLAGQDPFQLVRSPLPDRTAPLILFFIVGGIIAPVAEEIVFRGLIFNYLRCWGLPAAVLISTALFAAMHLPAIPVTQIVGGVVFAVAFHTGKSLIVPIIIHILGNLAIFTLSML